MKRQREANEIKIWKSDQAPEEAGGIIGRQATWIAMVPRSLVCPEVEALFLRWHTETHPVVRRTLSDGFVLFGISHPAAEAL
jgi:hypothetical protein